MGLDKTVDNREKDGVKSVMKYNEVGRWMLVDNMIINDDYIW